MSSTNNAHDPRGDNSEKSDNNNDKSDKAIMPATAATPTPTATATPTPTATLTPTTTTNNHIIEDTSSSWACIWAWIAIILTLLYLTGLLEILLLPPPLILLLPILAILVRTPGLMRQDHGGRENVLVPAPAPPPSPTSSPSPTSNPSPNPIPSRTTSGTPPSTPPTEPSSPGAKEDEEDVSAEEIAADWEARRRRSGAIIPSSASSDQEEEEVPAEEITAD
ncbi:hypothetical protein SMACR_04691 [Sordaria macrospora]|uniref:Uncharacterized protein n=1 Tax=Sordaria macrospora TaxID=5147 RepID=A0A8S8ZUJ0_SORMA|nr:hypothetical protein SMACR_04691 [Sordaria macrospora]WPJ61962.1 hypothetical protein SMAC4_04691 [Sordaria macrospora]